MEALLGSTACGVSSLALPWGKSAHYMQPAGQRRGRGAGSTCSARPRLTEAKTYRIIFILKERLMEISSFFFTVSLN